MHDHRNHRLAADRRALTIALVLVAALMAGEIVAGLIGHSLALLADALGGAAGSLAASLVLARASRESLNVRGAFLHLATDVAAFGAAAVAGALILATGWDRFDPLASLAVAALMLWSSVQLMREST